MHGWPTRKGNPADQAFASLKKRRSSTSDAPSLSCRNESRELLKGYQLSLTQYNMLRILRGAEPDGGHLQSGV